jgi:cytochrome c
MGAADRDWISPPAMEETTMKVMLAVMVTVAAMVTTAPALASMELAKKARCVACHHAEKKMVGPSFKDIGAKYKDQAGIEATLAEKVRNGGAGSWGEIPMMPNGPDKIADADLQSLLRWILDGAATN